VRVLYRSGDTTFKQDKFLKAIFQTLQRARKEHPNVNAWFVVPVQKNGDTVAIVLGCDQVD
jgi:hypothetical protein